MPLGSFRLNSLAKAIGGGAPAFSPEYMIYGSATSPFFDLMKYTGDGNVVSVSGKHPPNVGVSYDRMHVSPNGQFMAIAHGERYYVSIYENVNGTWSRLDPRIVTFAGFGNDPNDIRWSPDSQFLLVTGSSPRIAVYKVSYSVEEQQTVLDKLTDPTIPSGTIYSCRWNPQNSKQFAVGAAGTPHLRVYTINETNTSYTLTASAVLSGNSFAVEWNPAGTKLVSGITVAPFVTMYSFNGTTLTADSAVATSGSNAKVISWFADGSGYALINTTSPFYHVYNVSGTTSTKQTLSGFTIPATEVFGMSFNPDTSTLFLATTGSPFLYVYNRSGNTYSRQTSITPTPYAAAYDVDWNQQLQRLFVYSNDYPYVRTYSRNVNAYTSTGEIFPEVNFVTPAGRALNASYNGRFNPQGTHAVVTNVTTSPFLNFYSFNKTTETFTKLTAPTNNLTPNTISWNPAGTSFVIGGATTPYIRIFNRSSNTLTEVTGFTAPTATISCSGWSPDGNILQVGGTISGNFIRTYSRSGNTFTVVTSPSISFGITVISWNRAGTSVFYGRNNSTAPNYALYNYSSGTFTPLTEPLGTPFSGGGIYAAEWSPDDTKLAVMDGTAVRVFLRDGNTFTQLTMPVTLGGGVNDTRISAGLGRGISWSTDGLILTMVTAIGVTHYNVDGNTVTSKKQLDFPGANPTGNFNNSAIWVKPV
jgi:WD40 repeat protein